MPNLYYYSYSVLHHMMIKNVKLRVGGHERITLQGVKLHWSEPFLMAQLKLSWQYRHSGIARIL